MDMIARNDKVPARLGTDSANAGDSSTEFHTHDELSEPRFGDWLMPQSKQIGFQCIPAAPLIPRFY